MTPRRLLPVVLAFAVVAGAWVYGCSSVPTIPARGNLAGLAIEGPVDHPVARDYVEGRELPRELEEQKRAYLSTGRVPDRETLKDVAMQYSPDVATLLFIETVSALPRTRRLRRAFEQEVALIEDVGLEAARANAPDDLLVLVVPGWFYVAHGDESGADLAAQRRILASMGVEHRLVAVDENGTVESNANVVAEAIRRASPSHRILLVSASKGGAEVALALGNVLATAETKAVVGWLSIGGVVRGTPFADRVFEPDLCWLAKLQLALDGFDMEGARSLRTAPSERMYRKLDLPLEVPIVSFVAAPLSGHVSDRGAFGYRRLRDHGPNDGLTLLVDELVDGSTALLAPGVDHFFAHPARDIWTVALFRVLLAEWLGADGAHAPTGSRLTGSER
jgi:hypothetical protein